MDPSLPSAPPHLPQELILNLLSSLLPPLPHLIDPSLISPSLLQRLQYLPPSTDDPDAFLSPFPSASGQPLSTALSKLEKDGHVQGPVQYTHDGEVYMARVALSPAAEQGRYSGTDDLGGSAEPGARDGGVEVWFSYEAPPPALSFSAAGSTAPAVQWLYHSTRLPLPSDNNTADAPSSSSLMSLSAAPRLSFHPSPRLVPLDLGTPPLTEEPSSQLPPSGSLDAPDNYWDGFTPPTPSIRLPDDPLQGEGGDDAYWAQYSRGPSRDPSRRTSYNGSERGGSVGPGGGVYDRPAGDRKISAGFPAIDTKLNGLKMSRSIGSDDATPTTGRPSPGLPLSTDRTQPPLDPKKASEGERLLRQKVEATISTVLKRAWTEHSRGAAAAAFAQEEAYEQAGMEWLRLGREVVDAANIHKSQVNGVGPSGFHGQGQTTESAEATKARIEVCREMWSATQPSTSIAGTDDAFWRLIEESIRMPRGGFGPQREEQGWEQS